MNTPNSPASEAMREKAMSITATPVVRSEAVREAGKAEKPDTPNRGFNSPDRGQFNFWRWLEWHLYRATPWKQK